MSLRFSTLVLSYFATLRVVGGAATSSSIACNNSPSLCSRPYNNVTYLGAHDSPFVRNSSNGYTTSGDQYYNTSMQLSAGVRLVTAQVQLLNSSEPATSSNLHVCHSDCSLLDAGTLSGWLQEVKTWMDANPYEVVTVLLVNGANADATALAAEYSAAGADQYAYTQTSAAATTDWPTLQQMISQGKRLVNFIADVSDNAAAPYLMDEFTYIFENNYDNASPSDFSCEVNRPQNLVGQTTQAIAQGYMSIMNHFLYVNQAFGIQTPNDTYANTTNGPSGEGAGNLGDAARNCGAAYGKAPTFLLVDFFNVGPAIQTADTLNGISNPVGRASLSQNAPAETSAGSTVTKMPAAVLCALLLAVSFL